MARIDDLRAEVLSRETRLAQTWNETAANVVASAERAKAIALSAEAKADVRAMQIIASLNHRLAELNSKLEVQTTTSTLSIEASVAALNDAVANLKTLNDHRDRATTQLATSTLEMQTRLTALSDGLAKLAASSDRRNRAETELETAKRELANLKASTSWRVTSPIRALKDGPAAVGQSLWSLARKARNAIYRRMHPASYVASRRATSDEQEIRLLTRTSLFDPDWYLTTYPDVRDAGVDPAGHYLQKRRLRRRAPGLHCDSR